MKKILVLGGTRFFGKVLVENLIKQGHEVTVATRGITEDTFKDKVKRLVIDREDKESLSKVLMGKKFDVVYDNICFSPNATRNLLTILKGNIDKYIVTSTLAVYDKDINIVEESFNPYTYKIVDGEKDDFTYGEGKRLVEAVAFQEFDIPTVAVRFPVVIGENDYTQRLLFFVNNIKTQVPLSITGLDNDMSLISQQEAGEFLAWLQDEELEGPMNANSNGTIKIKEIIEMIEEKTGKKVQLDQEKGLKDPYSGYSASTLNNAKAKEAGYLFKEVKEEVDRLVEYYLISR